MYKWICTYKNVNEKEDLKYKSSRRNIWMDLKKGKEKLNYTIII